MVPEAVAFRAHADPRSKKSRVKNVRKIRQLVGPRGIVLAFAILLAAPASSLAAGPSWNQAPQQIPPGTYSGCVTGASPDDVLRIAIAVGRGPDSNNGSVACWYNLTDPPNGDGERSAFTSTAASVAAYNPSAAPAPSGAGGDAGGRACLRTRQRDLERLHRLERILPGLGQTQ